MDEQSQGEDARGTVAFQQLVARYVKQRRIAPGEDLISDMLAALRPDERPLTYEQEAELVQNVGGVLLAGHNDYLRSHWQWVQALARTS